MAEEKYVKELKENIVKLDINNSVKIARKLLQTNIHYSKILSEAISSAVNDLGDKYEKGEIFLTELIFTGEILKQILSVLKPKASSELPVRGTIVIGTVAGDLHDIGKSIVVALCNGRGLEVIDLGVDVSSDIFIDAIKKHKAKILGMSALLSTTMDGMKNIMNDIRESGLRDTVKIIVGGAPLTKEFGDIIGVDYVAKDALEGVKIITKWASVNIS